MEQPLEHKGESTYRHHQEGRQSYAVRVTCSDGCYCLGQIAQYHADGGYPATYLKNYSLFHGNQLIGMILRKYKKIR